ncbi:gamma subclass chorismate mutase AroQ [Streptomyces sp. NPDC057702]|uniref:gamma subclass chorismate mutase AroQ n=1 Tax=unclassified Streptomyces TaxID=2593676 RepID=UPI0036938F2C
MSPVSPFRSTLVAALAALAVLAPATPAGATAAPAAQRPAPATGPGVHADPAPTVDARPGPLRRLADLSARRLLTAGLVAAAKWGTDRPVDDPERERQVLATVARQAGQAGADPRDAVAVFRDQIEASKLVQRALHRRWRADPRQAPTQRPDLAVVRAEINRINGGLVRAIVASEDARAAPLCPLALPAEATRAGRDRAPDPLSGLALAVSLRSVCSRPATTTPVTHDGWRHSDRHRGGRTPSGEAGPKADLASTPGAHPVR